MFICMSLFVNYGLAIKTPKDCIREQINPSEIKIMLICMEQRNMDWSSIYRAGKLVGYAHKMLYFMYHTS